MPTWLWIVIAVIVIIVLGILFSSPMRRYRNLKKM
jgi:Sec-independent protein translocase protein TatA